MYSELDRQLKRLCDDPAVALITSNCGFFLNLQAYAEEQVQKNNSDLPVLMSSLSMLEYYSQVYGRENIAIFTANKDTLEPLLEERAGQLACEKTSPVVVGCADLPGFEAVRLGEKVDAKVVGPAVVELAQRTLQQHPNLQLFLFECTQLTPYSKQVSEATHVPVEDIISCVEHSTEDHHELNELFDCMAQTHESEFARYGRHLDSLAFSQLQSKQHVGAFSCLIPGPEMQMLEHRVPVDEVVFSAAKAREYLARYVLEYCEELNNIHADFIEIVKNDQFSLRTENKHFLDYYQISFEKLEIVSFDQLPYDVQHPFGVKVFSLLCQNTFGHDMDYIQFSIDGINSSHHIDELKAAIEAELRQTFGEGKTFSYELICACDNDQNRVRKGPVADNALMSDYQIGDGACFQLQDLAVRPTA